MSYTIKTCPTLLKTCLTLLKTCPTLLKTCLTLLKNLDHTIPHTIKKPRLKNSGNT